MGRRTWLVDGCDGPDDVDVRLVRDDSAAAGACPRTRRCRAVFARVSDWVAREALSTRGAIALDEAMERYGVNDIRVVRRDD